MEIQQPHDVEEALDEALSRLLRGESIQSCLLPYPEAASQILPLLGVAQELRKLGSAPEPAPSLARGRQRLLCRAAEIRAARRAAARQARFRRVPRLIAAFFAPLLLHGAASTVVLVALLVVLLGGSTMMASASSLPGDPLYPVKRVAESVHLALTFDEDSRASVRQAIEARRIQEARAVLERRRQVTLAFRGVVESFDGSTLVAAGLTIRLGAETRVLGDRPIAGRAVAVVAVSQRDGGLVAQRIEILAPTPTPTRRATATVANHIPSPTPAGGPVNWEEPQQTGQPEATPMVSLTSTLTAAATLTATLSPTGTLAPSVTPPVVPTPEPNVVQFAGLVESIEPDRWRIGGREVLLTAETHVDERAARAEIGAWARVRAAFDSDGRLLARRIVVERGADKPAEVVTFEGLIEAIDAARWSVGGQTVAISPTTEVVGEPRVGLRAAVQGWAQPGGELWATRIVVLAPEDVFVSIEGTVEALAPEQWRIAGRGIRVDAETLIIGEAAVGAWAQVWGLEEADGEVTALLAFVTAQTTPSPTPAASASPTPTPSLTASPQATATPTGTPTPSRPTSS